LKNSKNEATLAPAISKKRSLKVLGQVWAWKKWPVRKEILYTANSKNSQKVPTKVVREIMIKKFKNVLFLSTENLGRVSSKPTTTEATQMPPRKCTKESNRGISS